MTLVLEVPELSVGWWASIGVAVWYLFAVVVVKLMGLSEDGDDFWPEPAMTWAFSPIIIPIGFVIRSVSRLNPLLATKKK